MPRVPKQLTAKFVRTAKPGQYFDGNGLILRVMPSSSRQWVQRIVIRGKRCDLGLGGYPLVTLAEARANALENRKIARAGGDPRTRRKNDTAIPRFAEAVDAVIELNTKGWKKGSKSAAQWRASLRDYAMPHIGDCRVDSITTAHVMAILLPIWHEKAETARRVRQRISAVMKWSIAQGYRHDNPAGDAVGAALPRNHGITKHQRALPYERVGDAIRKIRASKAGISCKLALEFLVLTAARSGEVRFALWREIDFETATWTIPAERMKAKRGHRVPLSARAVEILRQAKEIADGSGLLFPSPRGRALSDNTMSKLCRESAIEAVPHGFRSSFRDWGAERTNAPRAVLESALAHVVGNKVEAAYARSDLFERRRKLMEAWANYLSEPSDNVVQLRA